MTSVPYANRGADVLVADGDVARRARHPVEPQLEEADFGRERPVDATVAAREARRLPIAAGAETEAIRERLRFHARAHRERRLCADAPDHTVLHRAKRDRTARGPDQHGVEGDEHVSL